MLCFSKYVHILLFVVCYVCFSKYVHILLFVVCYVCFSKYVHILLFVVCYVCFSKYVHILLFVVCYVMFVFLNMFISYYLLYVMFVFLNMFISYYLLYVMFVCNNDFVDCDTPLWYVPLSPSLSKKYDSYINSKTLDIKIDFDDALKISILCFGVLTLLRLSLSYICTHVTYVTFDTDLNLCSMKKYWLISNQCTSTCVSFVASGLFISSECNNEQIVLFIICINPNIGNLIDLSLKLSKIISQVISGTLPLYIFCISVMPATCILCLMMFQIWCHSYVKHVPCWLPIILILLSNDINLNPEPHFQNNLFNFMSWNVNSLAKDNFQRVCLIEAHNSIFNYDLISICETSLNDTVELPDIQLSDYTFIPANNPANSKNGGVGLFYKNSLPVAIHKDLSFDESNLAKFWPKKKISLSYIDLRLLTIPLLNSKTFFQTLKIYIQTLKQKILLQCFLLVILMLTPSFGGLEAIQLLKACKLKIFSLN